MKSCHLLRAGYGRLVGDPIDVVTGANLDVQRDFALTGPVPLVWRRYYSSAEHRRAFALGWGQTHEYDRRLEFDVDGLRYVAPVGVSIGFAPLTRDGAQAVANGITLRRVSGAVFEVAERGQPRLEFTFTPGQAAARLTGVYRGRFANNFYYDARGALERITDAAGRTIRVEADARGRVTGLILAGARPDQDRVLMTYRYDLAGNLVEGIDPYKNAFRGRYDTRNRLMKKTDRRGYAFYYDYDEEGRCVHVRGEDGALEMRFQYFPQERRTVVTRFDGGEWTYFYNEDQALTLIIDPYGGATKFTFDDQGRLAQEIDPNGNASTMVYDTAGGLIGKTSPLGHFRAIPEDPDAPDPLTHRVPSCPLEWEYGDLVPRSSITLPEPNDPAFKELSHEAVKYLRTAAPDRPAARVENDLGVLLREVAADGAARSWSYDPNGNVSRYHDRDGSTWGYEYTSWNQVGKTTDPLGNATIRRYTPGLRLAAVTDPRGTTSEYRYDHLDRLVEVRRHGATRETYRYDAAGNLVEKRDGNGAPLLTLTYGPGNLKTARRLASGETHRFAYNAAGQFLLAASDAHEVTFAYDAAGRRVQDQRDGLGVEHRFGADGLDQTTVFDKFVTHYRRTGGGTLVIQDPTGREHRVRLLGHGLIERTLANGTAEVSQFDADGRCLVKSAWKIGAPTGPWNRLYTYSGEGDLLRVEDTRHGASRFTYDAAHRLTAAESPTRTQAFAFDAADNLLGHPGPGQLSVRDGNRLGERAMGATRFVYDDRDRLAVWHTEAGAARFRYDARDQLVQVHLPGGGGWSAQYDPLGRRVSKTHQGRTTQFYWDTDRLMAEIAPDGRVRVYVYPDAFALTPLGFVDYDNLDADPASGERFYVYTNQIGTPVRVENDAAAAVWSADLSPFGTARVVAETGLAFALRFPGHYWDEETGLHYNRFRYYSPELGRYLQGDPLGIAGGLNLYAYPNAPLNRVDVLGLNTPGGDCPKSGPGPKVGEEGTEKEETESPGKAAQNRGTKREQTVADLVGGQVSNEEIRNKHGKTDIDVVGPKGELIAVGGPAKAKNPENSARALRAMKEEAAKRGVPAKAYYTSDTPDSVVNKAKQILGPDNVHTFDE